MNSMKKGPHVHSSSIQDSQEVGTTQVSADRWTDKTNVACAYNRFIQPLKEWNSYTWNNLNETWRHYVSEISQA